MSRSRFRAAVTAATVGAALCGAASAHAAVVHNPRVSAPLPVTAQSYPFGAANHTGIPESLSKIGYTESEHLVSGRANVYTWPAPGAAKVRTADAPYTTRILVRRPRDRSKFSGRVVVEMLNPSNLFDLNIGWAMAHREIVRNGDAWVGITAKPIAVVALKAFDPQRYAKLSFANPLPTSDPDNCATVPPTPSARPRTASCGTSTARSGTGRARRPPRTRSRAAAAA